MKFLLTIIIGIFCYYLALVEGARNNSRETTHTSWKKTSFIVGGSPAETNEFPYQISFQFYGSHICGGSIIGPSLVVTAAHCIAVPSPIAYIVVAGVKNLKNPESTKQKMRVLSTTVHPDYNDETPEYDIALVKLAQSLKFNEAVGPVALPTSGYDVPDGSDVLATGWGTTSGGGSTSDVLLKVLVPTVPHDTCADDYESSNIAITNDMLCAGVEGKDTCQGDSGGPIVYDVPETNVRTLVGLTSFGIGCAREGYPGVYTKVSHFIDWITSNSG